MADGAFVCVGPQKQRNSSWNFPPILYTCRDSGDDNHAHGSRRHEVASVFDELTCLTA